MQSFLKTKSVCSGMVRLLEEFCVNENLKPPVHHYYHFEERIPLYRWFKKLKDVDLNYKKEGIGLEIAKLVNASHIGITAYMVATCKSLIEYISYPIHYTVLWYDFTPKQLFFKDDTVVVSWELPAYYKVGLYQRETEISEEFQVAVMYQRILQLTRKTSSDQIFVSIEFAIPPPKNPKIYEDYFNCPVIFNAERTTLVLSKELMEMQLDTYDPTLFNILVKQANSIIEDLPKKISFLDNVNRAIIKAISEQSPKVSTVAEYLDVTPRALQRTLKEHQLCFQTLLNNTRILLAKQYLQSGSLTIVEIADLLGYKEQTSFNRAFKAKTSYSPMQWRELNLDKAIVLN